MRDAMKVPVLLRWDLTAYRCCRDYGLYGSSANSDDVKSVRVCIEEGESERLRPLTVAREVTESKNESSCFRQEIMP